MFQLCLGLGMNGHRFSSTCVCISYFPFTCFPALLALFSEFRFFAALRIYVGVDGGGMKCK
jgi:hypothetical protein